MEKVYLPLKFLFTTAGANGTAVKAAEATCCTTTSNFHVCANITMKKVVALHKKYMSTTNLSDLHFLNVIIAN